MESVDPVQLSEQIFNHVRTHHPQFFAKLDYADQIWAPAGVPGMNPTHFHAACVAHDFLYEFPEERARFELVERDLVDRLLADAITAQSNINVGSMYYIGMSTHGARHWAKCRAPKESRFTWVGREAAERVVGAESPKAAVWPYVLGTGLGISAVAAGFVLFKTLRRRR
eukprot:gnl/Trimastix_PCT/489.p2 GENE.gnl/Trimastix_PCT/489~~gnl/Trimastix_PCT/489.p2  ORF type:complete len:169 (+),score=35.38 gnl/Trimastix_PCT/489:70-576(+)